MGRKPLIGTVAANVQAHGTGALNIDATRIGDELITAHGGGKNGEGRTYGMGAGIPAIEKGSNPHRGRWPANVALDTNTAHTLDTQSGTTKSPKPYVRGTTEGNENGWGMNKPKGSTQNNFGDSGGASRFFKVVDAELVECRDCGYWLGTPEHARACLVTDEAPFLYVAKAPTRERPSYVNADGVKIAHATVKPLALMRWLIRLVTPPGDTILDPFAGSGTTGEAAELEGFDSVLIEREADYLPVIQHRLNRSAPEPVTEYEDLTLFDGEAS